MKHRMKQTTNSQGFTIIELMFATIAFSIVLMGATIATTQIGRLYYKAVITSRTQQTARMIIESVSQPVQFGGINIRQSSPSFVSGIQTGAICAGNKRYTYGINAQVDPSVTGYTADHKAKHAMYEDQLATDSAPCTPLDLTQNLSGGKDLVPPNMRLARFDVTPPAPGSNIWGFDMLLIYGIDDLLVPDGSAPTGCTGAPEGSQWCATAMLSTKVYKRVN